MRQIWLSQRDRVCFCSWQTAVRRDRPFSLFARREHAVGVVPSADGCACGGERARWSSGGRPGADSRHRVRVRAVNILLEMTPKHELGRASISYLVNIRSLAEEARLKDPEAFARSWHLLMKGSIVS